MTVGQVRRKTNALITRQMAVKEHVPDNRQAEIREYLELFGYKPDHSILQVHIAGYFGRGVRKPSEIAARERAAAKYGGRTFTIVGRTHDPALLSKLILPKKKQEELSPGYAGYLFKAKERDRKSPDETLPLDFVPVGLAYPRDWKQMFGTRGYLIAMHVPSKFVRNKNELLRRLRRLEGVIDVKKEWKFLEELKEYGYPSILSTS